MSQKVIMIDDVWTEGDHTTITGTATNAGAVIDITDATVELVYEFKNRPPGKLTGSVVSGTDGTWSAQFASGIPHHGTMRFHIRITDTNPSPYTSKVTFQVEVRRKETQAAA